MPLHIGKGRSAGAAISRIIDYVENPNKTENGRLVTSYQCNTQIADAEFTLSKRQYIFKTGRRRGADDIIAYHLRQSFVPGEITPEDANRLGRELAMRFTKGDHAFIVCTHTDKAHIHNHIIWNSVNLDNDRKFRNFLGSARAVRRLSDTLCVENGYSIVENPGHSGVTYDKWLGEKPPAHRELLRAAIDRALEQKPADMDRFIQLLREADIEAERRGKFLRLKASGWKKFVRMDAASLGDGYGYEDVVAVLDGKRAHTPKAKTRQKVSLLVDVQSKLRQGKGSGYVKWVSGFNLKQTAQTMSFLAEHKLQNLDELKAKTAEASAKHNALSRQIKDAESRMAEIAVLKTHIINYAKTRDVYVQYRKAGYSQKFREENEADILLHQAAKDAFEKLGVKKLPTVKRLQEEYAVLLAQKKAAYPEYRKARDEMRELLTVRANVEKILGVGSSEEPNREEKLR